MSIPSVVANLVKQSIHGNLSKDPQPPDPTQPEAESIMPILKTATSTTEAIDGLGKAALHPHDEPFVKKKQLGKGGFGYVNLCERKDKVRTRRSPIPHVPHLLQDMKRCLRASRCVLDRDPTIAYAILRFLVCEPIMFQNAQCETPRRGINHSNSNPKDSPIDPWSLPNPLQRLDLSATCSNAHHRGVAPRASVLSWPPPFLRSSPMPSPTWSIMTPYRGSLPCDPLPSRPTPLLTCFFSHHTAPISSPLLPSDLRGGPATVPRGAQPACMHTPRSHSALLLASMPAAPLGL